MTAVSQDRFSCKFMWGRVMEVQQSMPLCMCMTIMIIRRAAMKGGKNFARMLQKKKKHLR